MENEEYVFIFTVEDQERKYNKEDYEK